MGKKAKGDASSKMPREALDKFAAQLEDASLVNRLVASDRATEDIIEALAMLTEQAVRMGIDYRKLKGGWHHPSARTIYRAANHRSMTSSASRQRAEDSRHKILEVVAGIADGVLEPEVAVCRLYAHEIGLPADSPVVGVAAFAGVFAALRAELLLPMRAQIECQMNRSLCGAPLPEAELKVAVMSVTEAVLKGVYSEWRYTNPVGREQLRGLSEEQIDAWREPTLLEHTQGLQTHEDAPGELGFFWATKIGGPSHGFDYESQCLLPLLANARHKVIFVSIPQWPHHPIGRAHWRLLWAAKDGAASKRKSSAAKEGVVEPRLWLETVNCDFEASALYSDAWDAAVLHHAVSKADSMRVTLSVESYLQEDLKRAVKARGHKPQIQEVRERMVLRPSNGVIEASDYLSSEHDWVQTDTEITRAFERALYRPEGC